MKKIKELISLKGRRALITGAVGKIGQEIALTIAELGGDLVLIDLPESDYNPIKNEILDNWNIDIECISCDLEDKNSRINLIKHLNSSKNRWWETEGRIAFSRWSLELITLRARHYGYKSMTHRHI